MEIQSTSVLGAFLLTRGVSLMIGGYPSEVQMVTWLIRGHVLSQSYSFFIYLVVMVVLFLIGQRTQRAQLKYERDLQQQVAAESIRSTVAVRANEGDFIRARDGTQAESNPVN